MLIFIFWLLFFVFLAAIGVYIIRRYETRTPAEFLIKLGTLSVMLVIGAMALIAMFRYYHNLPEEYVLRPDTPLEQKLQLTQIQNLHPKLAEQLSEDNNQQVRYALAANFTLEKDTIKALLNDPDENVRKRMARNLSIPISLLESQLDKEQSPQVRATIEDTLRFRTERQTREKRKTPLEPDPLVRIEEALESLGEDSEDARKIRLAIGSRPFLYSIDALASDPNPDVRYAVASNTATSSAILKHLLKDTDPGVQVMAAISLSRKDNTDIDLLETFSQHGNPYVREAVAANISTPIHILEQLSRDGLPTIVAEVAANPNTPSHVLLMLANAEQIDIRRRVARHPQSPDSALRKLALEKDDEIRRRVAANPMASPTVQESLSNDENPQIRAAVAMNAQASPSALAILSNDPHASVRAAVAANPNTPADIVKKLVNDSNTYVQSQAEHNLRNFSQTLRNLSKDTDIFIRRQVAQNHNTPAETLTELAKDADVHVRERVALNPNTPRDVLSELAQDSAEQVRWAVEENPNYP